MNTVSIPKILLALLVIAVYGFSSIFSILHTSHMSHMHMGTSAPASECPFMVGEQGLCSMSLFDHVSAWQAFSSAFFPLVDLLLIGLVIIFLSLRYSAPPRAYAYSYRRGPPSLYQMLFSEGILNSKVF